MCLLYVGDDDVQDETMYAHTDIYLNYVHA